MHLPKNLKEWLKLFAADTRQAIIGYIVVAVILAWGGLAAISKTVLSFSIQLANTPLPLWATILLGLCLVLYVREIVQKNSFNTKLIKAYGAYWDAAYNMYCLSCMKPLKNSSFGPSFFYCSDQKNCNSKHILKDDHGKELTRQEAIDLLKKDNS